MKRSTAKSYALRIDGPLVKPLQELKKRNRRSLNAEINAALDAWISAPHDQSVTAEVASTKSAADSQSQATAQPVRDKKPSKRKREVAPVQAEEIAKSPGSAVS